VTAQYYDFALTTAMKRFDAVIFDLGGVVLGSPLEGITEYEEMHGIPLGFVNVNVFTRGEQGAFQRLERGELGMEDFYAKFQQELEDPKQIAVFAKFRKRPRDSLPKQLVVNARELFRIMLEKSMKIDPHFIHAIYVLRGSGVKVCALTNNFAPMNGSAPGSINVQILDDLFDSIVESAVEGVRKPEPKAYQLICSRLGVSLNRSIFLDDIGTNLKAAKALGMEGIQVKLKDKKGALEQMEKLLRLNKGYHSSLLPSQSYRGQRLAWDSSSTEGSQTLVAGDVYGFGWNAPVIVFAPISDFWGNTSVALAKSGLFVIHIDLTSRGAAISASSKDVDSLVKKMGLAHRKPIILGSSDGVIVAARSPFCQSSKCGGLILMEIDPSEIASAAGCPVVVLQSTHSSTAKTLPHHAKLVTVEGAMMSERSMGVIVESASTLAKSMDGSNLSLISANL